MSPLTRELLAVGLVAGVTGAASGLVAWGAMSSEVQAVRRELELVRQDVRELRAVLLARRAAELGLEAPAPIEHPRELLVRAQ